LIGVLADFHSDSEQMGHFSTFSTPGKLKKIEHPTRKYQKRNISKRSERIPFEQV
jgi:hypothetical protein